MQLQTLIFCINVFYWFSLTNAIKQLELIPGLECSYNYDLEVHAHRGERSTKELNFKLNAQVDVEILDQHLSDNDAYITKLQISHLRIIRLKNGGRVKHAVDKDLEKKLSKPFFFVQNVNGSITQVFFPHSDKPELIGLKKGIVSALNLKIHPDAQNTSYSTEEEDDSGIHFAYYDVNERNSTNLRLLKKWSSDDYLKHADERPIKGERHGKSQYFTSLEIENGAIKNARRSHLSYLSSDKPYNRPLNKPEFQEQPDFAPKASGESHLNLLRCVGFHKKRAKRSSEKSHYYLVNMKQDTLIHNGMKDVKWSSVGDPSKPKRTFYELLRCYSDLSVKKSELSQCVKELHFLAKTDDEVFKNIVNLTLKRSHLNFSTWSGLVGSIVVRGDYQTQMILSQAILTEDPRPLSEEEHAKLLEAIYFIPVGPLYPELLEALLSLHKNTSKSNEINVRAMLVTSGLVRRCHDAGYNRSLSENIALHLHHSFKTHPARFHHEESDTHDDYIWSHICAFGNLGHISSLNLITKYLDHDSSGIRYFAVSALRKLPTQHTDHHLLRILRNDEHVTVKAGVIEVFIERRQNLTDELRHAFEDALWISEEDDELDTKIIEFLENHDEKSHYGIKNLRKRRSSIFRKKRAFFPALKPREFSLGVSKEWKRAFGGGKAGAEAIMRFVNQIKVRIGIFGGSFEVNLDNLALFRAHVIMWSFDIINGKASFKMGAGFKNDIPKDFIHTVTDTVDEFLAKVDGISSIFTEHVQRFLDKLKTYLPFSPDGFLKFISQSLTLLSRTTQVTRFGKNFDQIVIHLRNARHANKFWLKISGLVKKLSKNVDNLSTGFFTEASYFLNKFVDLFSRLQFTLPQNFPVNFDIEKFLIHINGPLQSTTDAVKDYFRKQGSSFPKHFFEKFHFKVILDFIQSLDKFKITALRLIQFGNSFLKMVSVFRDVSTINIPRLDFPKFNIGVYSNKDFDWRTIFNFQIGFSEPEFAKFREMIPHLTDIFLTLGNANVNFDHFFAEILPDMKIKFEAEKLFLDINYSSIPMWLKAMMKYFYNLLSQLDTKLFDLSNTMTFLDEISKITRGFMGGPLRDVCKLQQFMLKSAEMLKVFGEDLEKDMILTIQIVKSEAKQAIREVINITSFIDEFIKELKQNVSHTAKIFVEQHLGTLEESMESANEFAGIAAEFALKSEKKLTGLCYKTASMSGDVLDKIQSEAQNAVKEIADFLTSNSEGLVKVIIRHFKEVLKNLKKWYQRNLGKHLGKVAIISKTIDEFLSLVKGENKDLADVHKVFRGINNVIQHLNNLPTHAQKGYDFADKIIGFVTNGKHWKSVFNKLIYGTNFKLDFDEQLEKLCDQFQHLATDTIEHINAHNLSKTFREFVTKEANSLVSQSVEKLNLLKAPLEKARQSLEGSLNSVEEIEALALELRPFARHFKPVFHGISQLPNCSDMYSIFSKIITGCGREMMSFGHNTYNEYATMKSELEAFLNLLPDKWENLSVQKCISKGTCLSNALKKQAQSIANKLKKLNKVFSDFNFEDSLETCKDNVEELSRIFENMRKVTKLVVEFSFNEEMVKVTDLCRRITGKISDNDDGLKKQVKKRSVAKLTRNIVEYTRKANETQQILKRLVEKVFSGLNEVSLNHIEPFYSKLKNVQHKLNVLSRFSKRPAAISSILQILEPVVKNMIGFTQLCNDIVHPLQGIIEDILFKTSDFTKIFEGKLKPFGETLNKVSKELENVVDKVTSILNAVQIRQKGLDILNYKSWNQYQYCSADVCLRMMRRSSRQYLDHIFVWKYPHLDDLSSASLSKTGRWLVPGLFDDYKIRSVAQLSTYEMLLGMRGVAANAAKASLLVVVDTRSSNGKILKIVQLEERGSPFRGDMGGIAVVKSQLIWISSGRSLYGVRLSNIRNSMSSRRPSTIKISRTKCLNYQATSISYDDRDSEIWILGREKAVSYGVGPFGDILQQNKSVFIQERTRGFTVVRQYGKKYACISKCVLVAGYQCRLEFHKMDDGALDESTILRVVRTPTGLEAVQAGDAEHLVAAFSSGSFSEKEKIQRIAGDFEDRYFKFNVPVLKTEFSITENCLYFKLGPEWLVPRQRLFPFGEKKCGVSRKRRAQKNAFDTDIYSEELEKHHRIRRQAQTTDEIACIWSIEGKGFTGSIPVVPEIGFTISVFGISVYFFFGADVYYYANYKISLCLRDRDVRLALVPGVWLTVYAGASLPLLIVEVGVTVEARILATYLIPELAVRVDKWPLEACMQLRLQITPLSIRVYLWYRFRLCIEISYKPWFDLSIALNWCAKNTFGEWTWSLQAIHITLFDTCTREIDYSRPGVGECSAKQVGDKKYLVQWQGFTEDTKIMTYIVLIGSIPDSGDDHYALVGERQNLVVPNLEIMDERSVYVTVYAMNADHLKSSGARCPEFTAKREPPVITFINDGDTSTDIDFQMDSTSLAMRYGFRGTFEELSSIKWGVSSSAICTFSENEADVLPLQSIGKTYTVKKTGLNLASGSKYHVRVVLVDQLGLATVACSDGITIDTTPPMPRNFTVGKDSTKFILSVRRVSGRFQHFADDESPLVHYEWKLVDEHAGKDVTPFRNIPLTQRTPLLYGLSLTSGRKYTALLKGTNAAGLYAFVNVTGIIPDDNVPVCDGLPRDVTGFDHDVDKDFVSLLTNLTVMFSCHDDDSGIQSIQAGVGTYPGGEDTHPFVDIQNLSLKISEDLKTTWVAFTNVNITKLTRYYITVKVRDKVGYRKTISSDGILMDTTAPTVSLTYIRDGFQGIDRKYSNGLDVFPAHWENAFADSESGIGEYFVGLGTSPGLDDKSAFRSNNLSTKALVKSSNLKSGKIYYVTVIGCNRVGMCVNGSSNGAMVDFISPHTGVVIAGQKGPPLKITWINKAAWARWQWCLADRSELRASSNSCNALSFYDEHSGIRRFGLTVFSYDTNKMLTPVKTVGRVVSGGLHVRMPNGVFSVVVQAEDRAGASSNAISKPFVVDTTPPRILKLHHGQEKEPIAYTRTKDHLFTAFIQISEDISSIVSYSVSVSTFPEGDDILSFTKYETNDTTNIIRVNWTSTNTKTLENGRQYYVTVKSTNAAGLFVLASSLPLIFDNEPPLVSHVFDGWAIQDSKFHQFSNIYRIHWQRFTPVSEIEETEACLTSTLGDQKCNIHPKVKISNRATSHIFTNISLQSGTYCYACLGMKDKAGNYGNFWTNGALIDTSPPKKGRVKDGQGGSDRIYQRETNILYATWSGFSEDESSIHHYELAFGTDLNNSNIQPFTNVKLITSTASSNLLVSELKNGVIYYAQVVAYNVLGIRSDIAISDGVVVETTPPIFLSPVYDGEAFGFDFDYSTNMTSISVNWKCEDKDSGLRQVLVGIGTQPGTQDIVKYRRILPYTTTYTFNVLNLSSGLKYFSTVKCINNAGLPNSMSSDGIVIDSTPPVLRYINIGDKRHETSLYFGQGNLLLTHWRFNDFESNVINYRVSIHHMQNNVPVVVPRELPGNQTSEYFHLGKNDFMHNERYVLSVTAYNGVRLSSTAVSNSFLVDGTAPICTNIYDATLDGDKTKFSGHTSKLVVQADCYDVETGISKYEFTIKDLNTTEYIVPFQSVEAINADVPFPVVVDGFGRELVNLKHSSHYQIGFRVTNSVNFTNVYWTSGVKIDTTGPIFRRLAASYSVHKDAVQVHWELSDHESGIKSLYWSLHTSQKVEKPANFTAILENATETLIYSDFPFNLGTTYYVYLKAINNAGLATLFVSNGVVIDRTPPSFGRVSADFSLPEDYDGNPNKTDGASFPVIWSGFIDKESGIRSYRWAILQGRIETSALREDIFTDVRFTRSANGYIIPNQTIYTDTIYSVCIRVTNGAGLSTTNCSEGLLVKLGKLTPGLVFDGPLHEDTDFQLDDKAIWLHWTGFKDPVYSLKQYSWCYGTFTSAENDTFNCVSSLTSVDPPLKSSAHKFNNISLLHGQRYNVKVEAVNEKDEIVSAVSDGVIVDRTAPRAGTVEIAGSQETGTVYLTGISAPIVLWSMHEKESALEEFQFGLGTFPSSDDLFSFTKFDGISSSLNLGEIFFNLTDGLNFYVTVLGVNVLGLRTKIISSQIIVDWQPPTPGVVRDGNGKDDIDFQSDVERISASWNEFFDAESDILEYFYCVGSRPDSCNVLNQTSAGLDVRAEADVGLEHGRTYFVTVIAINSAGLSTRSSSNGVTVDVSPPVVQGFSIISATEVEQNITSGNFISHVNAILKSKWKISGTWDKIIDEESGIRRVSVCASTIKQDCDVHAWRDLSPNSFDFSLDFQTLLPSGTVLMLKLHVENGVGLKTTMNSSSIILDNSPPLKGSIKINGIKERPVMLMEGQSLVASWKGFNDFETGIKEYNWKICSADKISACVTEFVRIGLKNNVVLNDIGIQHGKEYQFVVRAINFAGLETDSFSNSFILDETSPEIGKVFNGRDTYEDKYYQSSQTEISTSWKGFQDKESGISFYKICVGSVPGLCDVSQFQNVGLVDSTIVRDLNLTHNATYYTTVQATNGAGQTGFSSSNGITIDLTPPIGGKLRDEKDIDANVTIQDLFVSTNWDEFYDVESGISHYVVCAGTIRGACDLAPPTTVINLLVARLDVWPAISSGTIVYSTLWAYNKAGGLTEIYSDGVLVDNSQPSPGVVEITSPSTKDGKVMYLTNTEFLCATWNTFNDTETAIVSYYLSLCSKVSRNNCPILRRDLNNKTSICLEKAPVIEGEIYTIVITATNEVGLSSMSKSTHFVIDTTEPDVGEVIVFNPLGEEYSFISSSLSARWKGFSDKESGVSEYLICIGKEPGLCDIKESVSVGKGCRYTWYNLSLVPSEDYFVSIRSVNNAGLFTDYVTSDPFTVDTTASFPAVIFDGYEIGLDIDYQQSPNELSASWFKVEDPESDIVKLYWCLGSGPGLCDYIQNTPVDVSSTKIAAFLEEQAKDGNKYYIAVTAVNGAGLSTTMVSDGITVDYTSPVAGIVVARQNNNTDYINNDEAISVHWSGFEDAVSGIRSYQFSLCEKKNLSNCILEFADIGLQTNITLSEINLENGIGYVVLVRATDFVGLSVEAASNELIVDETPPVHGWVTIDRHSAKEISLRWGNVYDPESEVSHYELCLGNAQEECNEIDYILVGQNTMYTFDDLKLPHNEEYYVTVKVTNIVGLSTKIISDGVKVDLTPPEPVAGGAEKGIEIQVSCNDDLLKVTWTEHEDKESGVTLTEWCIETVNDTCNLHLWEPLSPRTITVSAIIHSLSKISGVRAVVRITNGVGNFVLLKSSQCDHEGIFPPQINVSVIHELNDTRTVSVYQTNTDVIIVTWSLPQNTSSYTHVHAALANYNHNAVSTGLREVWRGEPLVFDFVNIPSGKSYITFSGTKLNPYVEYRPIVRVCNKFDLCTDSSCDPVIIVPDAPPDIQVNTTDAGEGTEQDRWQKYVGIPRLPREIFEQTLFVPDPLRVMIKANLKNANKTTLFSKHVPMTYEASVYRVTSGANETRNVTIDRRKMFNDTRLYSLADVCCSKKIQQPQIVHPDRQFIPVSKTNLFGVTVGSLGNGYLAASSQDAVDIFSTESLHITSVAHVNFSTRNNASNNDYVKVKTKNDMLLISVARSLVLQKFDQENITSTSSFSYITNCNYTMVDRPEYCSGDNHWSSLRSVGRQFAYDGAEIIAVSGRDPREGYSVVAIFKNDRSSWKLHQVLGHEEKDFINSSSIAINQQFLVVVGFGIRVYSKTLHSSWEKEATLSKSLSTNVLSAKYVYLTAENELFILTIKTKTLNVYLLRPSGSVVTQKCKYVFPESIELSGSLDVSESNKIVTLGIRSDGRDGAEMILYKRQKGCKNIGRVLAKTASRFDGSHSSASVAITEKYLVVGTPEKVSWPTDYVNAGTGRLYVTTFCKRNHVRKKVLEGQQKERIVCSPCAKNEKAYPGFEEQCIDCSNSICLNQSADARFRVSHCETYPCRVPNNPTIRQNISSDNLTVTEWTQSFDDETFYLPGSTQSYFVRLTQISATGMEKSSDSIPFSIDYTSPEVGSVLDGLGSDDSRNCSSNTTFSSERQCTSRSFSKTDLDYTSNTHEISARWLDFRDNESNIAHSFWCVGSNPLRDDIMLCENATGNLNSTLKGLTLQHNDKYYVTVLACNYAGLCTAKSSDGVVVDTTPPILFYVRDGLVGPDIDFQVFTNVIFANWKAEDLESGVVSYEICWGSEPGLDDVWEFQEIGNATRWYAKFDDGGLKKGHKYFVTVKAINGAGIESEPMTSNGIIVGKTEFVFSKNDTGSFFFDTANIGSNVTRKEVGDTFGTVNVPPGAVDGHVKFQMYSLGETELKNGTDDNTTVVDPKVVKPQKHFKLGDYSFQIKAYEPKNNTLQTGYRFKKPITISLVYDVRQMLKLNKKVVSDEVTKEDIDPVLLLWDTVNQTWFDAAKTCPEPWTHVDKKAKVLKVNICHLTQFALFWTFEAEYGMLEFDKGTNDTKTPPHAVIKGDRIFICNSTIERYGGELLLDIARRKGSTGVIKLTWNATIEPNVNETFIVSPMAGELEFKESQWNSSINLRFSSAPAVGQEVIVKLVNVSAPALLGNLTSVKITCPPDANDTGTSTIGESDQRYIILKIVLPSIGGALLIITMIMIM